MIYSYFQSCEGRDAEDELRLMLAWRQHHERLGIQTQVLGEYHARRHEEFEGYAAAIDKLTQLNDKSEARATFMRWLAMIGKGRIVMMGYNVFLYPKVWDDLGPLFHTAPAADSKQLTILQGPRPSLVVGNDTSFMRQVELFANCHVEGAPVGVTDDKILEAQSSKLPDSLDCTRFVRDYGQEGWENAIAVRYPRELLAKAGHLKRWQSIPEIRPLTIPEN